jgi:hypothetical protein
MCRSLRGSPMSFRLPEKGSSSRNTDHITCFSRLPDDCGVENYRLIINSANLEDTDLFATFLETIFYKEKKIWQ